MNGKNYVYVCKFCDYVLQYSLLVVGVYYMVCFCAFRKGKLCVTSLVYAWNRMCGVWLLFNIAINFHRHITTCNMYLFSLKSYKSKVSDRVC